MEKNHRRSLKSTISNKLRNEIVYGLLLPGERIKEASLTEKFGCSRGPIREALNQLEKEGFLQLVPNQGAVVTKISIKEIEDFYALLELLEGKAVEWSTPILTPEDIKQLKKINDKIRKLLRKDKNCIEDWIYWNLAFHRHFREKCRNEKLGWVIDEIRMRITRYRYTSLAVNSLHEYISDHDKIIESSENGDAILAGMAMRTHISRARMILTNFLTRLPGF